MTKVHDLRSAIEFLETIPGQMLTSDTEVDPNAEVSGVYRHIGAGGTVARPTKEGPAMLFNKVKGFPDARVSIGMLSSRHFYTSFSSDLQSGLTLVPLSPEIYSRTYLCYLKHAQLNPTALEMIKYFQEIIS